MVSIVSSATIEVRYVRGWLDGPLTQEPDRDNAVYSSGKTVAAPATSWISRGSGRIWVKLPFMAAGVAGTGRFAANAAGRARWGGLPPFNSDTYVRLRFGPRERIGVYAPNDAPLPERASALVRVRQRQDEGVGALPAPHPGILDREGNASLISGRLLRPGLRDSVALLVHLTVRMTSHARHKSGWSRGR